MRLLTINTHSLSEKEQEKKLVIFADAIEKIQPDIIAMQEVNQTAAGQILDMRECKNITAMENIPLKRDNYLKTLADVLKKRDVYYNSVWLGIKNAYNVFDEGIGIMSKSDICECDFHTVSRNDSYRNWKTRKILGIKTQMQWFYSVHMGWWEDKEEPFYEQWERLSGSIAKKETVWLMGDFNSPDNIRGEGYSAVLSSGWYDTYNEALKKDDGYTVCGEIDGWRNTEKKTEKKRMDYIFTNKKTEIKSSAVIFNGENEAVISDHFGVIVEV